jgi:LysR family transcriptional regulator, flagellar master operon regulator
MDIVLARTFLEVVSTGSFQRAAERLHVSQTAVSARIRSLETQLGQPLFVRNKAGAVLTRAGERFLRYAPTLVQMWQRARHDVAGPEGHSAVIAVGGELSLWNPLLLKWILWMKGSYPSLALRTQVGLQDGLTSAVAQGLLDLAIVYAPRSLPGLKIEPVVDEKLVMVTTDVERPIFDEGRYVYVDWGPEFAAQHDTLFPGETSPGLLVGLGPLGLSYILTAGGAGYFRMSSVLPYLADGRLKLVPGAPEFSYPAYAVYPLTGQVEALEQALDGLRKVGAEATREIQGNGEVRGSEKC